MNTVCKRIAIVSACIFAVGLLLGIAGFVLGGTNSVIFENGKFRVLSSMDEKEMDIVDEEFSDIESIVIDVDYFEKVVLKEGNSFSVKGSNPKALGGLSAKNDSGTLTVSDSKQGGRWMINLGIFNSWGLANNGVLEITYPANTDLNKVDLIVNLADVTISDLTAKKISANLDMGNLTIDRISTDQLLIDMNLGNCDINEAKAKQSDINGDSGEIDIKNIESDGMELDSNLGSVSIEGILRGKSVFDLDMGELDIKVYQSEEDTSYFIETDLGEIKVNGNSKHGTVENRIKGSENNIHIDTELGGVSLNFY